MRGGGKEGGLQESSQELLMKTRESHHVGAKYSDAGLGCLWFHLDFTTQRQVPHCHSLKESERVGRRLMPGPSKGVSEFS